MSSIKKTTQTRTFVSVNGSLDKNYELFECLTKNKRKIWFSSSDMAENGIVQYEPGKFVSLQYDFENLLIYDWQVEDILEEYPDVKWKEYEENVQESEITFKTFDSFREAIRFFFGFKEKDKLSLRKIKTVTTIETIVDIEEI